MGAEWGTVTYLRPTHPSGLCRPTRSSPRVDRVRTVHPRSGTPAVFRGGAGCRPGLFNICGFPGRRMALPREKKLTKRSHLLRSHNAGPSRPQKDLRAAGPGPTKMALPPETHFEWLSRDGAGCSRCPLRWAPLLPEKPRDSNLWVSTVQQPDGRQGGAMKMGGGTTKALHPVRDVLLYREARRFLPATRSPVFRTPWAIACP
jgi:hypothetical protein